MANPRLEFYEVYSELLNSVIPILNRVLSTYKITPNQTIGIDLKESCEKIIKLLPHCNRIEVQAEVDAHVTNISNYIVSYCREDHAENLQLHYGPILAITFCVKMMLTMLIDYNIKLTGTDDDDGLAELEQLLGSGNLELYKSKKDYSANYKTLLWDAIFFTNDQEFKNLLRLMLAYTVMNLHAGDSGHKDYVTAMDVLELEYNDPGLKRIHEFIKFELHRSDISLDQAKSKKENNYKKLLSEIYVFFDKHLKGDKNYNDEALANALTTLFDFSSDFTNTLLEIQKHIFTRPYPDKRIIAKLYGGAICNIINIKPDITSYPMMYNGIRILKALVFPGVPSQPKEEPKLPRQQLRALEREGKKQKQESTKVPIKHKDLTKPPITTDEPIVLQSTTPTSTAKPKAKPKINPTIPVPVKPSSASVPTTTQQKKANNKQIKPETKSPSLLPSTLFVDEQALRDKQEKERQQQFERKMLEQEEIKRQLQEEAERRLAEQQEREKRKKEKEKDKKAIEIAIDRKKQEKINEVVSQKIKAHAKTDAQTKANQEKIQNIKEKNKQSLEKHHAFLLKTFTEAELKKINEINKKLRPFGVQILFSGSYMPERLFLDKDEEIPAKLGRKRGDVDCGIYYNSSEKIYNDENFQKLNNQFIVRTYTQFKDDYSGFTNIQRLRTPLDRNQNDPLSPDRIGVYIDKEDVMIYWVSEDNKLCSRTLDLTNDLKFLLDIPETKTSTDKDLIKQLITKAQCQRTKMVNKHPEGKYEENAEKIKQILLTAGFEIKKRKIKKANDEVLEVNKETPFFVNLQLSLEKTTLELTLAKTVGYRSKKFNPIEKGTGSLICINGLYDLVLLKDEDFENGCSTRKVKIAEPSKDFNSYAYRVYKNANKYWDKDTNTHIVEFTNLADIFVDSRKLENHYLLNLVDYRSRTFRIPIVYLEILDFIKNDCFSSAEENSNADLTFDFLKVDYYLKPAITALVRNSMLENGRETSLAFIRLYENDRDQVIQTLTSYIRENVALFSNNEYIFKVQIDNLIKLYTMNLHFDGISEVLVHNKLNHQGQVAQSQSEAQVSESEDVPTNTTGTAPSNHSSNSKGM